MTTLHDLSAAGARTRGAKIVATLGPASIPRIPALIEAGVDVFRMNFSHGEHAVHADAYAKIRAAEAAAGRPIGVLMDLQGPKLRIGKIVGGFLDLERGDRVVLDLDRADGGPDRIPLPHPELFAASKPDDRLLLDDGRLALRVTRMAAPDRMETEVLVGGRLSDRKGVSAPDAVLPVSPLTDKDRRDLAFGLELGADWVALSFVQTADDLAEAQRLIGGRAAIMSKIEKPSAVDDIDRIVEMSDGCMVARGDLGVEIPAEDVPIAQVRIVQANRAAGKPVIVATQMLDSMVKAPTPTRAEAADVAKAVHDGADAVMLSAESAVGDYPIETVSMMARIVARAERDDTAFRNLMAAGRPAPEPTGADAITHAAARVAETIGADAIVAYSMTGSTVLRASRERPVAPIIGLTPSQDVARRMTLSWGVRPLIGEDAHDFEEMVSFAVEAAKTTLDVPAGGKLIVIAGVPFGTPGATNILRIANTR